MQPQFILYRLGHSLHKNGLKRFSRFLDYCNRLIFGCWLPSSSIFGSNAKLGYWGIGIVIHSNSIIGNNVTIGQNVTIGRNFGDVKVPVLGNDVYVGAGSVIFGEITIGDNVIIGSNSVVNKSILANSTVAGNPFKILRENRTKRYYEYDNH